MSLSMPYRLEFYRTKSGAGSVWRVMDIVNDFVDGYSVH